MHVRYLVALTIAAIPLSLLVPACVVPADDVESVEQVAEVDDASSSRFDCRGLNPVDCMMRCAQMGTACRAARPHPTNGAVGSGDLFACRTALLKSCDYRYSNGDRCSFFKPFDQALCLPGYN